MAVVGGHSVRDQEPKFGLSVTGDVAAGEAWSNDRGRPGQVLVLTKAIGTGVLGQAIKQGVASADAAAAAIRSMTTTNATGARAGRRHGVTAATDVTGFGLLNHLRNITRASKVTARIELARVPLLPDALAHLRANLCPGGSKANRVQVSSSTLWISGEPLLPAMPDEPTPAELLASLACDAQTSGGLLLCVSPDRAASLVDELRADSLPAAIIGSLHEPQSSHSLELV